MAACWVLWISLLGAVVLSFNIPKYLLDGVIDKQELPDIMIVLTLAITFFMVSHFVNIFNQPVVIGQRRKVSRVFNLILMIVLALISMTFMLALVNSSISQKSGFKTTVILAILLIISLTLFYLLNRRHKSFIKKYLNEEESNEKREICLQDTEGDSQASG
jgi:amino acid transporter